MCAKGCDRAYVEGCNRVCVNEHGTNSFYRRDVCVVFEVSGVLRQMCVF